MLNKAIGSNMVCFIMIPWKLVVLRFVQKTLSESYKTRMHCSPTRLDKVAHYTNIIYSCSFLLLYIQGEITSLSSFFNYFTIYEISSHLIISIRCQITPRSHSSWSVLQTVTWSGCFVLIPNSLPELVWSKMWFYHWSSRKSLTGRHFISIKILW